MGSSIALLIVVLAMGREPVIADVEDVFEAAAVIAEYADERLRAAALGEALPDPPVLHADIVSLRTALAMTLGSQILTVAAVLLITRQTPRQFVRATGLNRYEPGWIWRPVLVTFCAYVGVAIYATIATVLDWDILIPQSTVPGAVADDGVALVLTGITAVVGAPVAEEIMHRGLVFGGLARWGFWPAAVISAAIFSGIHLDTGSFIPFFGIGLAFAWLFWRRGTLWDAIFAHLFFNLISYLILIGTRGST